MIHFRDRMARGHTRTGWLDSRHSFSFGHYQDPAHMGFRALRVLNEDRVIPGAGFPTHDHRDAEILTYVLAGALRHEDSLGNGSVIRAGEVQRMSAGTGVSHLEANAASDEPVHFVQIWIIPARFGLVPEYEQGHFPSEARRGRLQRIADPDGRDGAVRLHQDARIFLADLVPGDPPLVYPPAPDRHAWLQVLRGIAALGGTEMREGDGAAVSHESRLVLEAETPAEIMLFDLP